MAFMVGTLGSMLLHTNANTVGSMLFVKVAVAPVPRSNAGKGGSPAPVTYAARSASFTRHWYPCDDGAASGHQVQWYASVGSGVGVNTSADSVVLSPIIGVGGSAWIPSTRSAVIRLNGAKSGRQPAAPKDEAAIRKANSARRKPMVIRPRAGSDTYS